MARLTFPDEGSRSSFRTAPNGRPLTSAAGAAALVYLDAGATTLADIQTTAGVAIAGSSLNLDAYSRFPLFLGPADGTDTLYVVVDGGPVSPMYARVDDRLDAVKATADAAETPAGAQAKATAAQAAAVQRANHTGTQSADTLTDGTTNKAFLATERTKLSGVATGATANSADATLLARANHTGTQLAATVSDFSTAVVTAASGAYVPRSLPTIGMIGTSISAQCGPTTGDATALPTVQGEALGYLPWALIQSGQRAAWTLNAGVGGNTTTQMLARFATDVLGASNRPVILVIEPGPNDAGSASPPAVDAPTSIANITSMVQQARAAGMRVILGTVTPSSFITSAAQKAARTTVNRWIKSTAPTLFPDLIVVDWAAAVTDPATGGPNTAYFQNQTGSYVHPNPQGAARMGRALADALMQLLPYNGGGLSSDPADPTNLLGTAGFTSGNTAGVATGWTITRLDGSTLLGATRKVTRADGIAGEWQEVTVASGDVQALCQNTNVGVDWAVGDSVYGEIEFYCRDDWSNVKDFTFAVEFYNNVGALNGISIRSADGAMPYNPRRGVFRTPVGVVPVGATRLRAKVQLELAGAGRATFGFSRAAIRKAGS